MPASRGISVLTVLPIALLSACEAGTIENAESRPTLVAREQIRIGSVDDPETSLTRFRALEVEPDGRIYSLHDRDRRVRIHAPDGTPLGAFGGEGEGPGEFLSPLSMALLDQEIVVFDFRLLRASYFNLDGGFVRDVTFRPPAREDDRWATLRPNGVLRDGRFYGEPRATAGPRIETIREAPLLRLLADGSTVDTITIHPLDNATLILDLGSEPTATGQLFWGDPLYTVSPDRMEVVMIERHERPDRLFRVTKLAIGADTVWSREYAFEPIHYEQSYVDDYVVQLAERVVEVGFASSQRRAEAEIRAKMFLPRHLAAADRVRIGSDGSVWIALSDRDPVSTIWLVLRADGDVLGEIVLPDRFSVLYATEREVWGMDRDELDIPYIVQYAVR